jgi:hypothetical protein
VQIQYRVLLFLFTLIFSAGVLAESLDLSGSDPTNVRQTLIPITQIIAAEQTPPLALLAIEENPTVESGASLPSLGLPEFQSVTIGFPSFWFLLSITPNLIVGAHAAGFPWRGDNIYSIGPFINTAWGTAQKSISTTFHSHQLKGPDHFHLSNIAFGISRNVHNQKWSFGYGFCAHAMKIHVHVTDQADSAQNYDAVKKMKHNFLRCGIYRQIDHKSNLGSELFLSTKTLMAKLLFTCKL